MLDEIYRPTRSEWKVIFDQQQEDMDDLYESLDQLKDVLSKNRTKNRKALAWVNEMEKSVINVHKGLKVIRKRVVRIQKAFNIHKREVDESESSDQD